MDWKKEVKDQTYLMLPISFTFIFRKSIDLVSVFFVGHLGSRYLSASGLATVTANVTGNSMIIGLAGALSTLCSQLYSTKSEVAITATLPRAAVIICSVVNVPVTVLWLLSRYILHFLGQSEQLSLDAGMYLTWLIPGVWFFTISICIQNWLHSQSKTKLVLMVTVVVGLFHPIICYLLIYHFKFGYLGAALANSCSKLIELSLLLICLFFGTNFKMPWSTMRLWQDWMPFLKLGLPGLLMMSEWWASEIIIFLSGWLSNPELKVSAMAIYQNTLSICFMVPSAFHVVAVTRVGNALGENNINSAKLGAFVSPTLAAIASSTISLILFLVQNMWARLFTDNQEVIRLVSHVFPVLVAYTVADGVQSALTGVLKGLGKQKIAGPIVIFSYYLIGLPCSFILAFGLNHYGFSLDLVGLCIGTTIGTYIHMFLYGVVVSRTDWEYEAYYIHNKSKLAAQSAEIGYKLASNNDRSNNSNSNSTSSNGSHIRDTERNSDGLTYFEIRQLEQQQDLLKKEMNEDNEDTWRSLADSFGLSKTSSIDTNALNNNNNNRNSNIVNRKESESKESNGDISSNHAILDGTVNNQTMKDASTIPTYFERLLIFIGLAKPITTASEYELVQAYTDSLAIDDESSSIHSFDDSN